MIRLLPGKRIKFKIAVQNWGKVVIFLCLSGGRFVSFVIFYGESSYITEKKALEFRTTDHYTL